MGKRYQFARRAARQIQKAIRKSERVNPTIPGSSAPGDQLRIYIAKTGAGGIAALSGDTPGSATVDLYRIGPDGDLVAITVGVKTATTTAYNLSSSAVAATTYIHIKQEVSSGKMLVDFEDCG